MSDVSCPKTLEESIKIIQSSNFRVKVRKGWEYGWYLDKEYICDDTSEVQIIQGIFTKNTDDCKRLFAQVVDPKGLKGPKGPKGLDTGVEPPKIRTKSYPLHTLLVWNGLWNIEWNVCELMEDLSIYR